MARLPLAAFALLATACSTILAPPTPTPTPPPSPTATTTPRPTRTPPPTFTPTATPPYGPVPLAVVKQFLRRDSTQAWTWTIHHTCREFALKLLRNARMQGIEAYLVVISWESQVEEHAIVSFRTTDAGTVFVEPQTDEFYYLPSDPEWRYRHRYDHYFFHYHEQLCTPSACLAGAPVEIVEIRWYDYRLLEE